MSQGGTRREVNRMKIAVVDDSLPVQQSLGRLLASVSGVEMVGYAEDVRGALGLIDASRPDVVVLDVNLRGHDKGIDVLRHVVAHYPGSKTLVLSNCTEQSVRDVYLHAGANAYFDKSMEFLQARDWIAALLPHSKVENTQH